ncbi:MAG: hypothetical protein WAK75_07145 [Methanoregula sp.]|uniref:hypothetical protein n=1 Tax=Methanoregula sp. TaxID=2052170 RepID=UPI003BAFF12D
MVKKEGASEIVEPHLIGIKQKISTGNNGVAPFYKKERKKERNYRSHTPINVQKAVYLLS